MSVVFDTDIYSEYLRENTLDRKDAPITRRLTALSMNEFAISVVTYSEVMKGTLNFLQRMEKSNKADVGFASLLTAHESLCRFRILPYTTAENQIFLAFPAAVRRQGSPDCQIAAIAIANGLTVVTRNIRHFANIPGVRYEDWTRPDKETN